MEKIVFQAKPWKMDRISIGRENKGKTSQALGIKVERYSNIQVWLADLFSRNQMECAGEG